MSLRRNPMPPEDPGTRDFLLHSLKSLMVLAGPGSTGEYLMAEHDPKALEQAQRSIAEIEARMSPNLRLTILPSFTEVAFATDTNGDEIQTGIVRDMANGWHADRPIDYSRRITTTGPRGGWEFFVTPETNFTYFEVTKRVES